MNICKDHQETVALFGELTPIFQVLADENRQQILMYLSEFEGRTVAELAADFSLSRPAISHHLKVLKTCGLVGVRKQGTRNYYYLRLAEVIPQIRRLLDSMEYHCNIID